MIFFIIPAAAQGATIDVFEGDTFLIERQPRSTFYRWELEEYPQDYLKLISRREAVEEQRTDFVFEALREGSDTIVLRHYRRTAFSTQPVDDYRVAVVVRPPPPAEKQQPEELPPVDFEEDFSPRQPQRDEGDARQQQLFAEVDELLELERFGPAREIINEQIDKTRDSILERWIEKLAESYVREENYQEAIEQYRVLIEEFPDRKQAQWLFNIADAYREDGEDDQAQLILLRIRYRHRNSQIWPRAMRSLAEILTADENYDRARRILEEIIEGQNRNRHPKTILTLARLYDRQPVVRDYERAVEYYQKAARLLEDDEPEDADQARSRARYIIENYLQFGTE